jgi:hypothetical protein
MRFGDRRFGRIQRFGNSFTRLLQAPVQIMRQTIPNNDIPKPSYGAYHRYKGLSSMGVPQGI